MVIFVRNCAPNRFLGGFIFFIMGLKTRRSYPLELFCKSWRYPVSNDYRSALFFPLPDGDGDIRYGAVMLLK